MKCTKCSSTDAYKQFIDGRTMWFCPVCQASGYMKNYYHDMQSFKDCILLRIKDNGTARAITWEASFEDCVQTVEKYDGFKNQ